MKTKKYTRLVQTSVTNFLHHNKHYLFIHRSQTRRVDPGRLNGIGGRLEPGEDFLAAAIRETQEETGYIVSAKDVTFSGVVKLEGGYQEDWVMCFFKIKVPSKKIPLGTTNHEGKLIWLHQNKVLDSGYELVDDLNYSFKDIVESKSYFFITAKLNSKQNITSINTSKLQLEK